MSFDFKKISRLLKLAYNKQEKKMPKCGDNTFLVWEPCSKNHGEIVPGFAQYLTDLGYDVSVLISQAKCNVGLFSRVDNPKIFCNKLSKKAAIKYLMKNKLDNVKGILISSNAIELVKNFGFEENLLPNQRILKVVHEAFEVDNVENKAEVISLREYDYKNYPSTVVNPHFFGQNIKITDKSSDNISRFVSVGALRSSRKNSNLLVEAVSKLYEKNITNFRVIIVGKGSLKHIPKELQQFFEIKGRLNFEKMYLEMEKADFFLPLLDVENSNHENYITIKSSGSFQLIYGFGKVPVLANKFAEPHGLDNKNSIVYQKNCDLVNAMEKAINLTNDDYKNLQNNLRLLADKLYAKSLNNLKRLINE